MVRRFRFGPLGDTKISNQRRISLLRRRPLFSQAQLPFPVDPVHRHGDGCVADGDTANRHGIGRGFDFDYVTGAECLSVNDGKPPGIA